jgi:hypothetical protein
MQIFNLSEVAVSGNEDHPVMFSHGRNPNVVFGDRPALVPQSLLQSSVFAGNIEVTDNDHSAGSESLNPGHILSRTARLGGPEE